MSIPLYPIVHFPHDVLATTTQPVTNFGKPLEKIIKRMIPTMRGAEGIGLAANQVGLSLQLAVIEYVPREQHKRGEKKLRSEHVPLHAIVNPSIMTYSDEEEEMTEGCLSCPGIEVKVWRSTSITVRYQQEDGESVEKVVTGFPARIYQHEIDHLNGLVILDRAHGQKAVIAAYRANPSEFVARIHDARS